ncbi:hypothetical protein HZZ13_10630 [Bradyrhizobium sp. CNPSo 4010]|uniref:Uncharacterized protein n=1 Tax=Bradyrhizobium agreste TaxID=2751811 RepID=A0ABS0PM58_9BRAD|nr:hypothetical protein [Bradyrhizobium agreste]MBH5398243.1 hypothetical protein [Bradyrhizobium agreste]
MLKDRREALEMSTVRLKAAISRFIAPSAAPVDIGARVTNAAPATGADRNRSHKLAIAAGRWPHFRGVANEETRPCAPVVFAEGAAEQSALARRF